MSSEVVKPKTPPKLLETTILSRKEFTPEHWAIRLKKPEGYTFKAGQYVTIGTGGIERPYSIVSSPTEPTIELFIERIAPPEGQLTPLLYEKQVGDTLTMRPYAKGLFTMEPAFPNQVMVTTVTGIAPFVSMLRRYLEKRDSKNRFFILDGASFHDELAYRPELEAMAKQNPGEITYVPTVSRPQDPRNAGWRGESGRVNNILEAHLAKWGLAAKDSIIYVCGHPGMIEDVKQKLTPKGWKVKEERYWKD